MPRNIRTEDLRSYQFTNADGATRQHHWIPGNNDGSSNPYWTVNNNTSELIKDRVLASVSLSYDLTDNLSIQVRAALDKLIQTKETRWNNDTYVIADNGDYFTLNSTGEDFNTDVLLSYKKEINDDWNFNVNAGANYNTSEVNIIQTQNNGLSIENLFSVANARNILVTKNFFPKEVQSVYGFAQIAYKDAVFFDVTGRNDWSSTLPASNRSFFYPSFGITAVLSDLTDLPEVINFAKIRTSWAKVGNGTSPFLLARAVNLNPGGNNGVLTLSTTSPIEDLKPEQTISTEFGLDLRLFNNRVGLDFTYYKSNSTDQLFATAVPVASGSASVFKNGADIQNKGVEIILNVTPIKLEDFSWDIDFNFAKNDSKVVEIANDISTLELAGRNFIRRFRLDVGDSFGGVYSRGFERDNQGRVIVGADGVPLVTAGFSVKVADFNPDWLGGIRNTFNYKNLSLSFLIDIRQGGTVLSFSNAILNADGATAETLLGRDGTAVFGQNLFGNEIAVKEDGSPNDIQVNAQTFWQAVGGRNTPVGEAFVRDASNVRLRELVFAYSLSQATLEKLPFESVSLSLVGRNLFFFSNKAGDLDSEINTGVRTRSGNEADGLSSFSPPTARSIGFNLKLGF